MPSNVDTIAEGKRKVFDISSPAKWLAMPTSLPRAAEGSHQENFHFNGGKNSALLLYFFVEGFLVFYRQEEHFCTDSKGQPPL